jgi:hexosaminidase
MILALVVAALLAASPPVALAAPTRPPAPGTELRLVPLPRSITPGQGSFPLRGEVRIASSGAEDSFAGSMLLDEIVARTGARVNLVEGSEGDIVLARDASLADAGDEGYRIEVKTNRVRVTARTGAGIYYAVQTLRQMVRAEGIPAATILDRPALRWRGIQDDVSRGPVPTVAALERRIRTAAEFKLNLYVLHFEAAFDYRSQPLIAPPGGAL